ncbi:MAG TPA: hypothetical protein VFF39_07790 [Verrucomicrobiae bacterium]|nr:hypothetical protein [Verrucomicrobiae bacterium]
MANRKTTRSRKQRSSYRRFPEVRGKIVSEVEVDQDAQAILILFEDKTALAFDLDSSHSVFPELLNRNKGDWKPIKHWRPIYSPFSMVKW